MGNKKKMRTKPHYFFYLLALIKESNLAQHFLQDPECVSPPKAQSAILPSLQ